MIQSLKLNKPTGTSAKSKMNVLIDSLVEDPYWTLLIIDSGLFLVEIWFSSSLRRLIEDEINNISDSNLVDRGGAVKDQSSILLGMLESAGNRKKARVEQIMLPFPESKLVDFYLTFSASIIDAKMCGWPIWSRLVCIGDSGEQNLETYIEKSVLELESKSKAGPIAPPKPQHLCGIRTKEGPSSLPQEATQPISVCSCSPVESPVGQLDKNGSENHSQRNSYHSTRKSNDSWLISETMITESNKLSYTFPQTVLPEDHKINSNIKTFKSRVRRVETELEMIAPKPKPQKVNEQICNVDTRECYNNNPRNIHDPYSYGPTGIQSNKGFSQNHPDIQHGFDSLCVANKFCHWLEQG
ncbi:hypothetical protein BY996DRAFT_8483405 [Phakopsora pachyrhizi]|nr:hypothetical protein BY996DRAFT_8483405 [Phakopsora pachyrhizi]